jgi:membrane associated rhomboid family serine protease
MTAMFMHASWSHIVGNIGGLAAAFAQVAAAPASTVPNLGASGAIAAVMGGFLVTYPGDRIRSPLHLRFRSGDYIPAALLIGVWFITQFVQLGTVTPTALHGGVAYMAHVGGFIFGSVTARLFEARSRERSLGHG